MSKLGPRTCEYVTFHGKGDSVDVIKVKILRWEIILGHPGSLDALVRVFVRGQQVGEEKMPSC